MISKEKNAEARLKEMIERGSRISLTVYQIAYVLNQPVSEIEKYQDVIDKNLPENYLQVRFRRIGKIFGEAAKQRLKIWFYPRLRLNRNIRALINYHLKEKTKHTFDGLGYSIEKLERHLEKQFKPGMNWSNYGKVWHVDHKIPASWFEYKNEDDPEYKKCWGLNNLQPKFAAENISKNNRYADDGGQLLMVMK